MSDPKILVVDFDNTLFHLVEFPKLSSIRLGNRIVHWYVRRKHRQGWYVIINTARHDNALRFAVNRLKAAGIPFDAINENHPDLIAQYGDCRKINGTRTLDDMQIGFIGWFLRHFC